MDLDAINGLTLADVDRELIAKGGLSQFIRLAWNRVEPAKLLWNWHVDAIAEHLSAVARGQIRNLLILVPPGCMKTGSVSIFWPAWVWAEIDPATKFIYSSYAQPLSDKSAKQHRDLMTDDWYQSLYSDRVQLGADQAAQVRFFENDKHGFRFSTSVGGTVTGYHGDILVFDDLAKAQDAEGKNLYDPSAIRKANDFWFSTMSTRQANPETTRKVGIMQRLHHDDTAGRCIASKEYEVLTLPMEYERKRAVVSCLGWCDPRTEEGELLWPERYSAKTVETLKRDLGPVAAAAQLRQCPSPPGGVIFKKETFRHWGVLGSRFEQRPHEGLMLVSWDCAFKEKTDSDYVVGTVWLASGANFFLLDRFRAQTSFTKTLVAVKDMQKRWPYLTYTLVEDKANGTAVIDTLRDEVPGLLAVEPHGGKQVRAHATTALFAAEQVWFPPPAENPWIEETMAELVAFPLGAHDDEVDSITQALIFLRSKSVSSFIDAYG